MKKIIDLCEEMKKAIDNNDIHYARGIADKIKCELERKKILEDEEEAFQHTLKRAGLGNLGF